MSFPPVLVPAISTAFTLSAMVGPPIGMAPPALAQSVTPAQDGTGTQVNPDGSVYDITGGTLSEDGANLFHSFQQFGLSPAEVANFMADPTIQNILGRVTGGQVSVIDGLLQVTGSDANLYLINPAGILFGPNATLNLDGSFTATTSTAIGFGENWLQAIGEADYASLTGDPTGLAFGDNAAALVNVGNLTVDGGATLTLVGGSVINTGTLTAPGGQIVVMAVPGENLVRITPAGARLSLELATLPETAPPTPTGLSPLDLPSLLRAGAPEVATGLVVNPDGSISLVGSDQALPTPTGTALASGSLDVSGDTGGTLYILGELVGVVDGTLNAAGAQGGGTILVGGDYQGQGEVPNARRTLIDPNSRLTADAQETGDGGTIIAWADEATRFDGVMTARGGGASGHGGFVEVSGKQTLGFAGQVDVSAPQGEAGTLLLDPENITIWGSTSSPGVEDTLPDIFAEELSEDAFISSTVLASQSGNVVLEANNDITVEAEVSLTFVPGGSITFTADADGSGTGSFFMASSSTLETTNRNLTISGVGVQVDSLNTGNGNLTILGDEIDLLGGTGSIQSSGRVQLAPLTNGPSIALGGTVDNRLELNLTATDVEALENGFSEIVVGGEDTVATISVIDNVSFSDPVTLQTAGSIVTSPGIGALTSSDNASVTLTAGGAINAPQITTVNTPIAITGAGGSNIAVEISEPIRSGGGAITISGTSAGVLDGIEAVRVDSTIDSDGGTISIIAENIDDPGLTIFGPITSEGGKIELAGSSANGAGIELLGSISSGGGNITLTGSGTTAGITNQPGEGGGTIEAGNGNLTLITDNPVLEAGISGLGALAIKPLNPSFSYALGGVGTYLDLTELGQLANTFGTRTFGRLDGTGTLSLNSDITFTGGPVVTLQSDFVSTLGHRLSGTGLTNLTLVANSGIAAGNLSTEGQGISLIGDADGNGQGGVEVFGDVTTNGGLISLAGASRTGTGVVTGGTLASGGGNISLYGTTSGEGEEFLSERSSPLDGVLTLGNLASGGGTIDITGISTSTNLFSRGIAFQGIVDTGGGDLNATGTSAGSSGLVYYEPVTSGGGNITFTGTSTGSDEFSRGIDSVSNGSSLNSGGGDITFTGSSTASGGIIVFEPVSSGGGSITFTGTSLGNTPSARGIYVGQNITTQGGSLTFTGNNQGANGIELQGDVMTSGGAIRLTAPNSGILTQDLISTGGPIALEAGSTLTTGTLDSSNNSPGGTVTLRAERAIQVNAINTQGSTTGGSISATTPGTFQALGSFVDRTQVLTSLSSFGEIAGGNIVIGYGPQTFTVGDPSGNGTQAAINSGGVTLRPGADSTFSGSQIFGPGLPGEIRLLSFSDTPTGVIPEAQPPEAVDPTPIATTDSPAAAGATQVSLISTGQVLVDSQLEQVEQEVVNEFTNYFGGLAKTAQPVSTDQAKATLRNIQAQTGEVPAFLYVRFNRNPAGVETNSKPQEPTLELLLITPEGDPIRVQVLHAPRQDVLRTQEQLRRQITNPNLTSGDAYLLAAQKLYRWLIAPIQTELTAAGVTNIGFIMDSGLRTLPLAALHNGTQFLVEQYSLGLIPSIGLIDPTYVPLNRQSSSLMVGGSAEFINQPPLWAANLEMSAIQDFWSGQAVTGPSFTVDALQQNRQQARIIHLATHAQFLRGAPEHSYLQFFDSRLRLNQVLDLGWFAPQVELVTLSACQTAMGNLDAELGFAGFALQAGAKSALASLWKVSDEATAGLMVTFYQQLDQQAIKAETLRQTQLAMIRGDVYTEGGQLVLPGASLSLPPQLATDGRQSFSHPFYWSAFTMVGSPW